MQSLTQRYLSVELLYTYWKDIYGTQNHTNFNIFHGGWQIGDWRKIPSRRFKLLPRTRAFNRLLARRGPFIESSLQPGRAPQHRSWLTRPDTWKVQRTCSVWPWTWGHNSAAFAWIDSWMKLSYFDLKKAFFQEFEVIFGWYSLGFVITLGRNRCFFSQVLGFKRLETA